MITLDGNNFYVDKTNYQDAPSTIATYARGSTGVLVVMESTIFNQHPSFKLSVSQWQYELLKASFTKCHNTGVYLDYIDERNFDWNPNTGADDATHKYSTGVWFESLGPSIAMTEALFDPVNATVWSPFKRFTCDVTLFINTAVLK